MGMKGKERIKDETQERSQQSEAKKEF